MISVIVPVYNTEKYLDRCIQSVLAQTYTDFELLLVDDGSTDSSGAICDKYAEKDFRVRVFHKKNGGSSSARNMGLDNARGEWIAFVDSDDWIDSEMYSEMYALAERESVDAVYCDMVMEYGISKEYLSYIGNVNDHRLMYDCLSPITVVYFSLCNRLISREVFINNSLRALNGANMWEDVELAVKVRYYATSSFVINKAYYHYNRTNDNSTTRRKMIERVIGQVERVKQIEKFFISQGESQKYKHFISLLKMQAKCDLFEFDKRMWMNTFNEAKWSLYKMSNAYDRRTIIKFYLISFFGKLIIPILEKCRK